MTSKVRELPAVSKAIGGSMDYARLSQLYRPTDQRALAAEVRRLSTTGLSPQDIAAALRLALPAVLEMLGGAA